MEEIPQNYGSQLLAESVSPLSRRPRITLAVAILTGLIMILTAVFIILNPSMGSYPTLLNATPIPRNLTPGDAHQSTSFTYANLSILFPWDDVVKQTQLNDAMLVIFRRGLRVILSHETPFFETWKTEQPI